MNEIKNAILIAFIAVLQNNEIMDKFRERTKTGITELDFPIQIPLLNAYSVVKCIYSNEKQMFKELIFKANGKICVINLTFD